MTRIATQRLIDASAHLAAEDRALLGLLANHGIDDAALSRLLRVDAVEVAARRESLARRLGEQLGLPAFDVHRALNDLTRDARPHDVALPPAAPAPEPSAPTAASGSPTRRRRISAAVLAAGVGALAILIIVLVSGSSSRHKARTQPVTPHPQVQQQASLVTLPGAPASARGRIVVSGGASPRLSVSVTGLPPAGSGHYELWLYNSIIDARPLADLGASGRTFTVALPPGYRRFRWLDVSRQARGATYDSGASVLRASISSGAP